MKYHINKTNDGVNITINSVENKQELLENFELCQKGQCGCPTNEYVKLESMNVESKEDEITITLKSKADQQLELSEIKKCLEFTLNRT